MPPFRAAPVHLRIPASSANLGPGFDSCGLALGLYDEVVVRAADSGLDVDIAGEGAESLSRNEKNLVVVAMRAAFDALGGQPNGLEIRCLNRIPQSRGLGSSAAAVVAGVAAARELVLGGMSDAAALAVAAQVEGHPDNVAAAILGGFTVAWEDAGTVGAVSLPVAPALTPVAFVPAASRVSTSAARGLLPAEVPHAAAARTAGRAALLAPALAGRLDLLLAATEDALHQPYRLPAQPRGAELVEELRAQGHAAVLSGSGPTVLALCAGQAAAAAAVGLAGPGWEARVLPVDRDGARLVEPA